MRLLPTILFSLLTLGLATLAVLQQTRGNLHFLLGTPPLKKGQILYQFDPQDVGRIEILNHDGTRGSLTKTNSAWLLKEPWQDLADPRIVTSLIQFAARLQIEDVVDRQEINHLSEVGLDNDRIEIAMFDSKGRPLCQFRIGRYTAWRGFDPLLEPEPGQPTPSFPTLFIRPAERPMKDQLYVCSDFADPNLRTILIRDLFVDGLRLFRAPQVFHQSPLAAAEITLKEKNSEITLQRESLSKDSPWFITKPFNLATNPDSVQKLLAVLSNLQATQILDLNQAALPSPSPESPPHTITLRYFLPDGSTGPPVTATLFPPETPEITTLPITLNLSPDQKRNAILRVPFGTGSLLATLPRTVDSLRSRTMTSLEVKQIQSLQIQDFTDRTLFLNLEKDPHERAFRWHATISDEQSPDLLFQGPANLFQINDLFEALFRDEIRNFTDDAATNPKDYGLNLPIRTLKLLLKDESTAHFVIGEKLQPQFFARKAPHGKPLEISEEAFLAALDQKPHPELTLVLRADDDPSLTLDNLKILGLHDPKSAPFNDQTILLGQIQSRRLFANRLDQNGKNTPHVVELPPTAVDKIPLEPFRWRDSRLWNINRFEITGLTLKKSNQPPLELGYNFYSQTWAATQNSTDVIARLNTFKAEKLLKRLTQIQVQKWLGPISEPAEAKLESPSLEINIRLEQIDSQGNKQPDLFQSLKIAPVSDSPNSPLFFAKSSTSPDYFLLDIPTIQSLSFDLLE